MLKSELNEKWETILEECFTEAGYTTFRLNISTKENVKKSTGSILSINVEGRNNREFKIEYIIMKTIGENDVDIDQKRREMFKTEAYVYNNVLKKFRAMQRDLPESYKLGFPKYLKATDSFIIMEDLTMRNFVCEENYLDFESTAFALMELARFHALSFVMKRNSPEDYQALVKDLNKGFFSYTKVDEESLRNALQPVLDGLDSVKVKEKLKNASAKIVESMKMMDNDDDDEYTIITHGDYNYKNLLFTCDENGEPTEMTMLDFQLSSRGSPVTDFLYFLMTSAQINVILVYDRLRDIYHDSIRVFLKKFQCRVDDCYPKDVFLAHLDQHFPCVLARVIYSAGEIFDSTEYDDRISELFEALDELKLI